MKFILLFHKFDHSFLTDFLFKVPLLFQTQTEHSRLLEYVNAEIDS